jgi:hypothetical protein
LILTKLTSRSTDSQDRVSINSRQHQSFRRFPRVPVANAAFVGISQQSRLPRSTCETGRKPLFRKSQMVRSQLHRNIHRASESKVGCQYRQSPQPHEQIRGVDRPFVYLRRQTTISSRKSSYSSSQVLFTHYSLVQVHARIYRCWYSLQHFQFHSSYIQVSAKACLTINKETSHVRSGKLVKCKKGFFC